MTLKLSLSLPSKAKPPFLRSALRPAWSIFWDGTELAQLLAWIKKLRAGSFVSFAVKRKKARLARTNRIFFNTKRKRHFFIAFIYRLVSSPAESFFPLRSLASASRRRALFFFLTKRSKSQGLELMSDKFVKALFRQHKHPMKDRERTRCLGLWGMKDCCEALTFSPSIISHAGEQGGHSMMRNRMQT